VLARGVLARHSVLTCLYVCTMLTDQVFETFTKEWFDLSANAPIEALRPESPRMGW
jgi:hypothetical protein